MAIEVFCQNRNSRSSACHRARTRTSRLFGLTASCSRIGPNCLIWQATICQVSQATRRWFSNFTISNGVDDARTVLAHCDALRNKLHVHRELVFTALQSCPDDNQVPQIYGAWIYALDTIIQQASGSQTCSWQLEG